MGNNQNKSFRNRVLTIAIITLMAFSLAPVYAQEQAPPLNEKERQAASMINSAMRRAVAIVKPAVVYIRVLKVVETNPFGQSAETLGSGSGCIIDKSGYVITNNHVVEDTTDVQVQLADGRIFKAVNILTDPDTDLALIKIDPKDQSLPVASFGDSDEAYVGDFVMAIGSPFGQMLNQTVTGGIISFKGRQTHILGQWGYEDFIQTDADINTGNSGGPLINLYGEIIGINSNIFSPTMSKTSVGYGFAVPSNIAKFVTSQLINNKTVRRGYLGVGLPAEPVQKMRLLPPESFGNRSELAQLMQKLPENLKGVLVSNVEPGTPAAMGGIKEYDIIVKLDGLPMENSKVLRSKIAELPPGKEVTFDVWRNDKIVPLKIKLGDRAEAQQRYAMQNGQQDQRINSPWVHPPISPDTTPEVNPTDPPKLGVEVKLMTPDEVLDFGYPEGTEGIVIMDVEKDSLGAQAGLKPGQIIVTVDKIKILGTRSGMLKLKNIIKKADFTDSGITMVVKDRSGEQTITVKQK